MMFDCVTGVYCSSPFFPYTKYVYNKWLPQMKKEVYSFLFEEEIYDLARLVHINLDQCPGLS